MSPFRQVIHYDSFSLILVQDFFFTPCQFQHIVGISTSCQINLNGVRWFTDSVNESLMQEKQMTERFTDIKASQFQTILCWMKEEQISFMNERGANLLRMIHWFKWFTQRATEWERNESLAMIESFSDSDTRLLNESCANFKSWLKRFKRFTDSNTVLLNQRLKRFKAWLSHNLKIHWFRH